MEALHEGRYGVSASSNDKLLLEYTFKFSIQFFSAKVNRQWHPSFPSRFYVQFSSCLILVHSNDMKKNIEFDDYVCR